MRRPRLLQPLLLRSAGATQADLCPACRLRLRRCCSFLVEGLGVGLQRLHKARAPGPLVVLVAPPHVVLLGLGEVARAARDLEHSLHGRNERRTREGQLATTQTEQLSHQAGLESSAQQVVLLLSSAGTLGGGRALV